MSCPRKKKQIIKKTRSSVILVRRTASFSLTSPINYYSRPKRRWNKPIEKKLLKPFAKSPRKNTRRKNQKANKNKEKLWRNQIQERKLLSRPKENYYQDPKKTTIKTQIKYKLGIRPFI